MPNEMIHNRGCGPEIIGTRITVYNLLPYFLDAAVTEDSIAVRYDLATEQVAAARAYALNNANAVLKRHAEIEARIAAGNPPEVVASLNRTRDRFLQFKEWAARRAEAEAKAREAPTGKSESAQEVFPSFQQWLANQSSQAAGQP